VWENVVAACRRCNAKKMDRTPQEAGFHLACRPFAPPTGSGSRSARSNRAGSHTSSKRDPATST
jgi:5-methylcytosine-specific restriction endonuclease McrA